MVWRGIYFAAPREKFFILGYSLVAFVRLLYMKFETHGCLKSIYTSGCVHDFLDLEDKSPVNINP
jgi:hypothetical protein